MSTYLIKNGVPSLILGLAYFTAGRLGTFLAIPPGYASAVFPASGVALAALLWRDQGIWPGILLGSFCMNLWISIANNPDFTFVRFFPVGISIGLGASGSALLGAWLLKRVSGSNKPLDGTVNVFAFIVLSAMLSSMVSATVGVSALSVGNFSTWKTFWESWYTWWFGDMMGILIFAPLPLIRFHTPRRMDFLRVIEIVFLLFLAVAGIKMIFGSGFGTLSYPLVFLPFPFLVWVVFRFGQIGAVTGLCLISILTVLETVNGRGPFAVNRSQSESLFLLQTFLGVAALMTLTLSAALEKRKKLSVPAREVFKEVTKTLSKDEENPLVIPVLMGLGTLILTFFVFRAAQMNETVTLRHKVAGKAEDFRNQVVGKLTAQVHALDRMGARFEFDNQTPQTDWEADATNYLAHYQEIHALEWVDQSFHVRWIVPLQGNEQVLNMDLGFEKSRRNAMINARDKGDVTITPSLDLAQGGKGFLVYRPIFYNHEFGGFLLSVMKVKTLINSILEKGSFSDFRLSAFDGDTEIYGEDQLSDPVGEKWRQSAQLNFEGLTWTIWLEPKAGFLKESDSAIPELIMFIGVFMSFILTSATFYAQKYLRQSREFQASNQRLEKEITVRVEAERNLQEIRDNLEELVRQRTKEIEESRQELIKSEAHFHSLTENSPVGIFHCDTAGLCTYVNARWEEITGMKQEEALGRGWEKIFHPDDKERFFQNGNGRLVKAFPLPPNTAFCCLTAKQRGFPAEGTQRK